MVRGAKGRGTRAQRRGGSAAQASQRSINGQGQAIELRDPVSRLRVTADSLVHVGK